MTEVYRGTEIAITMTPTANQGWTARAEYLFPGVSNLHVEVTQAEYATEIEARKAVLQAAVESIDKQRAATGKL